MKTIIARLVPSCLFLVLMSSAQTTCLRHTKWKICRRHCCTEQSIYLPLFNRLRGRWPF